MWILTVILIIVLLIAVLLSIPHGSQPTSREEWNEPYMDQRRAEYRKIAEHNAKVQGRLTTRSHEKMLRMAAQLENRHSQVLPASSDDVITVYPEDVPPQLKKPDTEYHS